MALADATVRVILDLTGFDRELQTKVAAAARRAGNDFDREFRQTARPAADHWSEDFRNRTNTNMDGAGRDAGRRFGDAVSRSASSAGRNAGRNFGDEVRTGMLTTARPTGRAYSDDVLAALLDRAEQMGSRFGRSLSGNITSGDGGRSAGRRLERDVEPGLAGAARNIGARFGQTLSGALNAAAPGRIAVLGTLIGLLVSEGTQLVAAITPALGVLALIPASAGVAGAAVGTLSIAFKGVGAAIGAVFSGNVTKANKALKDLSPAAAEVVREFGKFSGGMAEFRRSIQQAFFKQLTGDVTALGNALLGPVRRGMTETATAAGRLADGLLDVVARSRNASVIEQVFQSAAGAFGQLNAPMQRFTQALFSLVQATLPAFDNLIASLGVGTDRFAQFLARASASGQAMGWVNNAVTTLGQLWQVAKNLTGVLGTIFDAARAASGGYLNNINQALLATRNFLATGEGRQALVEIFTGLHEVLQSLGQPLREAVIQLGAISQVAGGVAQALSQGVTDAIRGIGQGIAAAGPGLTTFAKAVSGLLSDIGGVLPSVGTSLGQLLTAISPLTGVFSAVIQAGASLLSVFSSLPSGLLTLIATFGTLRLLGIPNMFAQIGSSARTAASGLGSSLSSIGTNYTATLTSLQSFRQAQAQTAQVMSGGTGPALNFGTALASLGDRARAAGIAVGGPLLSGISRLWSFLGGGLGVALLAVSVMLEHWSAENQKAQQEVQEHNQRVLALSGTLDKFTGSVTAATRAQALQSFGQGNVADAARRLGVSISTVADAATNSLPAQRALNSVLTQTALQALANDQDFKNFKSSMDAYGVSVDTVAAAALGGKDAQDQLRAGIQRYHDSLDPLHKAQDDVNDDYRNLMDATRAAIPDQALLGNEVRKTADDLQKQADAVRKANEQFSPMQQLAETLATAMGTLADSTSSAADKARALDTALRILSGGTLEVQDANQKAVAAMAEGATKLQELADKYNIAGKSAKSLGISNQELTARQTELGKSLFDSAGNINFYSERANSLFGISKDLRQATLDQTAAIVDNAQKTGGDLTAAHQKAADVMQKARDQVIDWAKQLHFSDDEAKRFADSLGLFPDKVTIAFDMPGVPAVLQELGLIKGRIEVLPDKRTLRLDSNAAPLRADLEKLGFVIKDIPGTKDFTVEAKTKEAQAALDTFIRQSIVQRRPDMQIGGNIDLAKASTEDLRKFIEGLPVDLKPGVDPKPAQSGMTALLDGLTPPLGTPAITPGVDGSKAKSDVTTLLDILIPPPGTPQITPGINGGSATHGLNDLLGGLTPPPGTPQITPGINGAPAKSQVGSLLDALVPPPGTPQITPGINGAPAQNGLGNLLGGLTPPAGTPQITPGINGAPAQNGLNSLLGGLTPPPGTPQIAPGLNPGPALNSLNGLLLPSIYNSHADVGVGIQPASAYQGLGGLIGSINGSFGAVTVGANTGGGYGAVNALVGYADSRGASIGVSANLGGAYNVVDAFVNATNRRTATVHVTAVASGGDIRAAQGGIFQYFRSGGINWPGAQMKPMSAVKPAIVPPNSMRVIGDRGWGREAFIPLVRTAQSVALLHTAAQALDFNLVPRGSTSGPQTQVTVQPGAIVVQAPQSDPRLVARAVVNELTREAVV